MHIFRIPCVCACASVREFVRMYFYDAIRLHLGYPKLCGCVKNELCLKINKYSIPHGHNLYFALSPSLSLNLSLFHSAGPATYAVHSKTYEENVWYRFYYTNCNIFFVSIFRFTSFPSRCCHLFFETFVRRRFQDWRWRSI